MARNYDLIERLQAKNEKPTIQITEDIKAVVNTSKTNVIHMEMISRDEKLDEVKKLDKIFEVMLGKKTAKKINELDLTLEATQFIFEAIGAALAGEDLETAEARFQEAKEK